MSPPPSHPGDLPASSPHEALQQASSGLPEAAAEKEPLEVGIEIVVAAEGISPAEVLPGSDEPRPRRPLLRRNRVRLPLILFVVTCLSTWFAGATKWVPHFYLVECATNQSLMPLRQVIYAHWLDGLVYMLCVQGTLFAHEMGHYVYTLIYRVRSTLPFFIPLPIAPTGTMGAVIAMEGHKANRKQIFDIGIAGPLAGLAIAVPIIWIGVQNLNLDATPSGGFALDLPLALRWLVDLLHPGKLGEVNHVWLSQANPCFVAGWFGLIMTALNMMPVSQLDGGHITYTLWRKGAHWVARAFMVFVFAYITFTGNGTGILMAILVMFIGTDHPPTSDDTVPLGWFRTLLGYASLAIPIICFTPRFLVVE